MAEPAGESPRPFRKWLKTNQGVGAFLSFLLIAFLIKLQFTDWVHIKLRDGFTLGFFPRMGAVLMLFFTVALIVDSHRRQQVKELDVINRKTVLASVLVLLGTYVYFVFMDWIGFLLVTPFYMWLFIYLMGVPTWKYALVASLVATAFVFALFAMLGIELPLGVLETFL